MLDLKRLLSCWNPKKSTLRTGEFEPERKLQVELMASCSVSDPLL